jgi:hypothetical protein
MYLDTVQYVSKYIVCNVINSTVTNVHLWKIKHNICDVRKIS